MANVQEFQGEHRWLSNFWPASVVFDGVRYQSVEHAYQAAKTDPEHRSAFLSCTATEAKRLGRQVPIRPAWESEKLGVMRMLIEEKFAPGAGLADKLMATGDGQLIEGNHWGDTFWGVCRGVGRNHLGELLMQQRQVLQQQVLDSAPAHQGAKLEVLEHASSNYSPRTWANAKGADLTVAFAVDFTTAGEKLTHKAAGDRYVGIDLAMESMQAARTLYRAMRAFDAHSLNVAGNGIYTLAKHGWTQERVDAYVFAVLAKVHEHWPIQHVRSGGQTGVDMAGVTAAHALGIDALALLPKGFIQRGADKVDLAMTKEVVLAAIQTASEALRDGCSIAGPVEVPVA